MQTVSENAKGRVQHSIRTRPVKIAGASLVRVTRAEHGREPRRFHLAASALARFFKMPVVAHFFERAFAVELLFEPPQRFINGLAFFQSNFGQSFLTPLYAIGLFGLWLKGC